MSEELSQDARRLIDAARGGDAAAPEDKARIKARLLAELGTAAFGVTAATAIASAGERVLAARDGADVIASGASKLWLKLAKLATVAGTAGALVAGVAHVTKPTDRPLGTRPRVAEGTPPVPAAPKAVEPAKEATDAVPSAGIAARELAHEQEEGPLEVAPIQPVRERPRRRTAAPAAAANLPRDEGSLSAELRLLERAQRALREEQPERALALVHEHRTTFPAGALVEERSGIEAIARCMLGQGDDAARAFLARAPGSPLAARVRKECTEP